MKIKLIVNTDCAHDIHETTKYPRDWYKKKPTLKAGEILEVKEDWGNFYGLYYKCYNPKQTGCAASCLRLHIPPW